MSFGKVVDVALGMAERVDKATEIIFQYGMIDGDHHKQWVLDQVLRALLDKKYDLTIQKYNEDEDYEEWDVGIPP